MILTYRYRVKSKIGRLNAMARAVNFVWNYCNDAQKFALKHPRKWPSAFSLMRMTAGTSKELGIAAETVNAVCARYEKSRRQFKRPFLRFRGRRSLGWVPLKRTTFRVIGDEVIYLGIRHRLALSRPLPPCGTILDGSSFARDASGRWYLNIVVEVPDAEIRAPARAVAIDLGLKDLATLSTGEKIVAPRLYRRSEAKLGVSQRARKRRATKRIHIKIANRRRDVLHKLSTRITREFDIVCVGDVSAKGLARTNLAKSIHDAGWSTFRRMLAYKSIANGATYREVNEAYSTQACSDCGVIGGPKGRKGLVIREWHCECGAVHDRDVNAARNILRAGHCTPRGAIAA